MTKQGTPHEHTALFGIPCFYITYKMNISDMFPVFLSYSATHASRIAEFHSQMEVLSHPWILGLRKS